MRTHLLFFLLGFSYFLQAQSLVVKPFMQDVEPTSARISWETSTGTESTVNWGLTNALGNTASGSVITGSGTSQIHHVQVTGLQPNTRYYYECKTDGITSMISDFITAPLPASEQSFKLVAMSDMQQDSGNPTVFSEICNDGIIPYISANYSSDIAKELAFVMIPGDLVDNGLDYAQWANTFFNPSENLFKNVPVYPVLGNHEVNTPTYFKYFVLPDNGTTGFLEHWWYKDYANMRIIGLDSNPGFTLQAQLDWLQSVLDDAASNANIDFVFAQLHHPHHSELWPAGNLSYTGDVITKLETFSTQTGKPSLHFYGHTHAYSRGQSQNHVHAMVNVASAGGNIDYWNEFAQIDYPEHTVSQDDYGFVLVEVEGGANPQFLLKRISRGNVNVPLNNVLRDSFLIKRYNVSPTKPNGIFPAQNDILNPNCPIILQANAYTDSDGDAHGASQWQIATDLIFSNLVYDKWRQYQNWWDNVDLQANDDLTNEDVSVSLSASTNYFWRVRYRDQSLGWSEWSDAKSFSTTNAPLSANLLLNGGAEDSTNYWIQDAGSFEAISSGQCAGNNAYQGTHLFAVGGVCNDNAYGEGHQDVDISAYSVAIDAGNAKAKFGGYVSDYQGDDLPEFRLDFLAANGTIIGNTPKYGNQDNAWTLLNQNAEIPPLCRQIRFVLMGTRNAGNDNDSYFDEMFLKIDTTACTQSVSIDYGQLIESQISVFPTPASEELTIIYKNFHQSIEYQMVDVSGKVVLTGELTGKRTKANIASLSKGHYFLQIKGANGKGISVLKE